MCNQLQRQSLEVSIYTICNILGNTLPAACKYINSFTPYIHHRHLCVMSMPYTIHIDMFVLCLWFAPYT